MAVRNLYYLLLLVALIAPGVVGAQGLNTGQYALANDLRLTIATPEGIYRYETDQMLGLYDLALRRFEFKAPLRSFRTLSQPGGPFTLAVLAADTIYDDLIVRMALPDRDNAFNLDYFRGNRTVELIAEANFGLVRFKIPVQFEGLLNGQMVILNFTGSLSPARDELGVSELHLAAQGVQVQLPVQK